jgi:hypothetical protein
MGRDLAFAAFLAGFKVASVPLIILRVRGAKPSLALVAEDCSGLIARLVQVGDRFTRRLGFSIYILAGFLRFHDDTRAAILLPTGNPGIDQRREWHGHATQNLVPGDSTTTALLSSGGYRRARSLRTASSISESNSPRVSRTWSPPSFASEVTGNSAPPPGGGVTK